MLERTGDTIEHVNMRTKALEDNDYLALQLRVTSPRFEPENGSRGEAVSPFVVRGNGGHMTHVENLQKKVSKRKNTSKLFVTRLLIRNPRWWPGGCVCCVPCA